MSSISFAKSELAAAVTRGVRQCVVIGPRPEEDFARSPNAIFEMFAVTEQQPANSVATFIPTQFSSEPLDTALDKANFDKSKPSFFVWLDGATYSTIHAVIATLSFIASLPRGSAVVLDYVADFTSLGSLSPTALGALASRISMAGSVKHLIQPQAVIMLLRSIGFQSIVELAQQEANECGRRIVCAVV